MTEWAELIKQAPLVAIVLALGITVVYLFNGREKLQAKYTQDLVKATQSLQELTSQYLTQSFTDSAGWQEQVRSIEGKIEHSEGALSPPLSSMGKALETLLSEVRDLWEWHNKNDSDGVKLWYVRRSQEQAIRDLITEIAALRKVVEDLREG